MLRRRVVSGGRLYLGVIHRLHPPLLGRGRVDDLGDQGHRSTSTSTPPSPCSPAAATALLARKLPRYQLATPDRLWRHFLDTTGTVTVNHDHVRVDLAHAPTPPC